MVGQPRTLRSTQPDTKRGYATSWIQTTATVGMLVALVIIGLCRYFMDAKTFSDWGWRIPFWFSIPLLQSRSISA